MNIKNLLLGIILVCQIQSAIAQKAHSQNYFVTIDNDTTFCKDLTFRTNGQGSLNYVKYTDISGKNVEIKGRKEVPNVVTFCINGKFTDKTPMKANKPNGYVRFTERLVDGKLKIYLGEQGSMRGADNRFHATGTYRFFLKMPDGTYYKINNSGNLKKIIIPYLQQCDQFKSQYKGQYSSDEKPFVDMIKFYNSICK